MLPSFSQQELFNHIHSVRKLAWSFCAEEIIIMASGAIVYTPQRFKTRGVLTVCEWLLTNASNLKTKVKLVHYIFNIAVGTGYRVIAFVHEIFSLKEHLLLINPKKNNYRYGTFVNYYLSLQPPFLCYITWAFTICCRYRIRLNRFTRFGIIQNFNIKSVDFLSLV